MVELPEAAEVGRGGRDPAGEGCHGRLPALAKLQAVLFLQPIFDAILVALCKGERDIVAHIGFYQTPNEGPLPLLVSITFFVGPAQCQDLLGQTPDPGLLENDLRAQNAWKKMMREKKRENVNNEKKNERKQALELLL